MVIVNSGVGGHILRVPEGPTQDLIWNAQKSAPPPKNKKTQTHTHKKNVEPNVKATHCLIEFTLQIRGKVQQPINVALKGLGGTSLGLRDPRSNFLQSFVAR